MLVHSHDVYSRKALILWSAAIAFGEIMQFIIEVWCFSLNSQVGNTTLEYFSAAIPHTAVISFLLSPQASHIHYLISALYFPITSLLISRRREHLINSPSLSEVTTSPCFILCSRYCMSSLRHKTKIFILLQFGIKHTIYAVSDWHWSTNQCINVHAGFFGKMHIKSTYGATFISDIFPALCVTLHAVSRGCSLL